jgi:hypothetical protein
MVRVKKENMDMDNKTTVYKSYYSDPKNQDIFDGDKWHTEALPEDKTFRVELESGDAVYVLPY